MLRVQPGHYRDSFRRVVYDVVRIKAGAWTFVAVGQSAIGLNLGPTNTRECETKEGAARLARLVISNALDERGN